MDVRAKKWLKKLGSLLVVVLIIFGLARVYYRVTDDFRISNISYEMPYRSSWEITPLSFTDEQRLNQILAQEYTYLGKGAQSYVFASSDQKYVIKFFKFKHLRPLWLIDILPSIFPFKGLKERHYANKERKLLGVFDGYKIAYDQHRDPSSLVFIQLNIENNPKRLINIKDKIGFQKIVNLQNVPFIIQEKGSTLRVVLKDLLNEGQVVEAEGKIGQIIDLYFSEYQKGIYDRDHGVMHNTGFVGNKPIHLDVGKMTLNPSMKKREVYKPDLGLVVKKLNLWLKQNYPQYQAQLKLAIEDKLSTHFGEKYQIDDAVSSR